MYIFFKSGASPAGGVGHLLPGGAGVGELLQVLMMMVKVANDDGDDDGDGDDDDDDDQIIVEYSVDSGATYLTPHLTPHSGPCHLIYQPHHPHISWR